MKVTKGVRPISERVEAAFVAAQEAGRVPTALVLGVDDFPEFCAWAREALALEVGPGARYRDVPIQARESLFLSRLQLRSERGAPNALLL